MPELETVTTFFRKQFEERCETVGGGVKLRWQLKQDRPGLFTEQRQAALEQFKAVDRVRCYSFPVGDEFGPLPGEHEIIPCLLPPASDGFRRRRSIEHAIEFGGLKLAGVILQLALDRQTLWKKRPAPGIVMPSRGADQDAGHGIVPGCSGNFFIGNRRSDR